MRKPAFVTICLCAVVISACSHARSGTRGTGDTAHSSSAKKTQRVAAAKLRRQARQPRKKYRRTTRKQIAAPAPKTSENADANRSTGSSANRSQGSLNRSKFIRNCLDQSGMTAADCDALFARVEQ